MKKFTILTLLVTAINFFSFGQTMPNVTSSDIKYWVGSGTNESILLVYFSEDDTVNAYAWGYKWNGGTITLKQMLTDINNADSRLNITGLANNFVSFTYTDPVAGLNFDGCDGMWMHTGSGSVDGEPLNNGDIFTFFCYFAWETDLSTLNIIPVNDPNPAPTTTYTIHSGFGDEWAMQTYGSISYVGDSIVGEGADITYTFIPNAGYHVGSVTLGGVEKIHDVENNSYTVENIMHNDTLWVLFAVDKNNTITSNDILYWIGEGNNEVIFAANWCDPDVAFAWGYRFDGDSILVSDVMDDIKAADSRFDYVHNNGFVSTITFNDSLYNLALASNDYWMYNVNEGFADAINTQYVFDNDAIEFGGLSCGLSDDFWNNVWTTEITPISAPSTTSTVSLQQKAIEFSVYPNPANDYIFLNINKIKGNISMNILDVHGKIILTEQFSINNNMTKRIETSTFAKGIYFIQLNSNNVSQTQKLIVY